MSKTAKPAAKAAPAAAKQPRADATTAAESESAKSGGPRKLILMALPAVLVVLGAGLWFSGLFGKSEAKHVPAKAEAQAVPIYVDLPEMIANLDSDPRRPRYLKLRARVEVHGAEDERMVRGAMPRLQDLFQTYLRDMRPEDLRGSMGTYRLREELIARADVAAAPAHVSDVLFVEMLVQ
jgi:flagellar FliL protein